MIFFKNIVILILLCFAPTMFAAQTYTVSPLVIDTEVKPRDIIEKKITITNNGAAQITIYPTVNNISLNEGETFDAFLPPSASDRTRSLASWIEIRRSGIEFKPGETKEIPLTLRINPEPVPGTYHALIGFGNGGNQNEAMTQIKNGQAPSTIITVTIKEKKVEFLKLSKFIVDRFITKAQNQAAVYTFKNPGEEAVVPTGEIIFYDHRGEEVGMVPVNTEKISLQKGEEHTFIADVPTEGKFGKYKAFLSVEYGTSERGSMQDTSFFYIFPIKQIIALFTCMALFVILLAWYFHRKYLTDESSDDGEYLMLRVRETQSESQAHDIDLKKK